MEAPFYSLIAVVANRYHSLPCFNQFFVSIMWLSDADIKKAKLSLRGIGLSNLLASESKKPYLGSEYVEAAKCLLWSAINSFLL